MKQADDNQTLDMLDSSAKRGRRPMPGADAVTVQINTEALQRDAQAATELVLHQEAIALTYGEGLPYQRERVVHEAQFYLAQSAEAMLEAGKRLILIKENEAHGEFVQIVELNLGLHRRTAQQMMQAAVKFLSPRLESKAKSVSLLGRSKLFDLMSESDDDLEVLADGGTLAGHTLEEFEHMTRRELQAALRDHKQQIEAKDKVLADRNAKVDKLEERLHRPYKPTQAAAARTAAEKLMLDDLQKAAIVANGGINNIVEVMLEAAGADLSHSCRLAAHNDLIWLGQRLAEVMREHAIAFDLEAEVMPSWVREHSAKPKALQS